MNILFEPFHRWAAVQCKDVSVGDIFIASASFADDVTLVVMSLEELAFFWWTATISGVVCLVSN